MTMALKETESAKKKILKWLKLVGSRETGTGITNIDMSLKEGRGRRSNFQKWLKVGGNG